MLNSVTALTNILSTTIDTIMDGILVNGSNEAAELDEKIKIQTQALIQCISNAQKNIIEKIKNILPHDAEDHIENYDKNINELNAIENELSILQDKLKNFTKNTLVAISAHSILENSSITDKNDDVATCINTLIKEINKLSTTLRDTRQLKKDENTLMDKLAVLNGKYNTNSKSIEELTSCIQSKQQYSACNELQVLNHKKLENEKLSKEISKTENNKSTILVKIKKHNEKFNNELCSFQKDHAKKAYKSLSKVHGKLINILNFLKMRRNARSCLNDIVCLIGTVSEISHAFTNIDDESLELLSQKLKYIISNVHSANDDDTKKKIKQNADEIHYIIKNGKIGFMNECTEDLLVHSEAISAKEYKKKVHKAALVVQQKLESYKNKHLVIDDFSKMLEESKSLLNGLHMATNSILGPDLDVATINKMKKTTELFKNYLEHNDNEEDITNKIKTFVNEFRSEKCKDQKYLNDILECLNQIAKKITDYCLKHKTEKGKTPISDEITKNFTVHIKAEINTQLALIDTFLDKKEEVQKFKKCTKDKLKDLQHSLGLIETTARSICKVISGVPSVIDGIDLAVDSIILNKKLTKEDKIQLNTLLQALQILVETKNIANRQKQSEVAESELKKLTLLVSMLCKINNVDSDTIIPEQPNTKLICQTTFDLYQGKIALDKVNNVSNAETLYLVQVYIPLIKKEFYTGLIKKADTVITQVSDAIEQVSDAIKDVPSSIASLNKAAEDISDVTGSVKRAINNISLAKIAFYFCFLSGHVFIVASSVVLQNSVQSIMSSFRGDTALLFGLALLSALFFVAAAYKTNKSHENTKIKTVFAVCTFSMIAVSVILIGFYISRACGFATSNILSTMSNEALIALSSSLIVILLISGLLTYCAFTKLRSQNNENASENNASDATISSTTENEAMVQLEAESSSVVTNVGTNNGKSSAVKELTGINDNSDITAVLATTNKNNKGLYAEHAEVNLDITKSCGMSQQSTMINHCLAQHFSDNTVTVKQ